MAGTNGKATGGRSPRSVKEMAERIDGQFDKLRTLVVWLCKQQQGKNGASKSPSDGPATVQELAAALRQAVDCGEALLLNAIARNSENEQALGRDIARALALSGSGERFELTVESVIRNYCHAREDVRRYSEETRLPEDVRQDVVAGFTRVMEGHRLELELLGIAFDDVEPGTIIDPDIHEVVKRIPMRVGQTPNTVRQCIAPVFRWKTGDGVERTKPAKVVACSDATSRGPMAPRRNERG